LSSTLVEMLSSVAVGQSIHHSTCAVPPRAGRVPRKTRALGAFGKQERSALLRTRRSTGRRGLAMAAHASAAYNFGSASELDEVVYGCESPGNPQEGETSSAETVDEWMEFMKSKGIQRVVCLMADDELERFEVDLLATYKKSMTSVDRVDMKAPGAAQKLADLFGDALKSNEKVVTHCVGGSHRTGMALSTWLAKRHNLEPSVATDTMLAASAKQGANRAASGEKLAAFLAK